MSKLGHPVYGGCFESEEEMNECLDPKEWEDLEKLVFSHMGPGEGIVTFLGSESEGFFYEEGVDDFNRELNGVKFDTPNDFNGEYGTLAGLPWMLSGWGGLCYLSVCKTNKDAWISRYPFLKGMDTSE